MADGRIRGMPGLGYHFSAVLPRKHVPGINELTISEQLFPHPRSDRPTAPRRPFSTDLWWVRPKRSDVHEKAKRGGHQGEMKLPSRERESRGRFSDTAREYIGGRFLRTRPTPISRVQRRDKFATGSRNNHRYLRFIERGNNAIFPLFFTDHR